MAEGDRWAAYFLAVSAARTDDAERLASLASGGNKAVNRMAARWFAKRHDMETLSSLAEAGNEFAEWHWMRLLAGSRRLTELQRLSTEGSEFAERFLIRCLAEDGNLAELDELAEQGAEYADMWIVRLLFAAGDLAQVRERARRGSEIAEERLVRHLAAKGDAASLHDMAESGSDAAHDALLQLAARNDDVDELRSLRAARPTFSERISGRSDPSPAEIEALARTGRHDELRELAEAGYGLAQLWLARVQAEAGDPEPLRAIASGMPYRDRDIMAAMAMSPAARNMFAGEYVAAQYEHAVKAEKWLAGMLADAQDVDGLAALAGTGSEVAKHHLATVLASRSDVERLRRLADDGDPHAAGALVVHLVENGRLQELEDEIAAGTEFAYETGVRLAERQAP
jgi:hypothetical protein